MILRDMCPDCQHPYSVHGHGGEGENAYPVCPPEIRDEMAEVIESAVDEDLPADPTRAELQAACMRAADAILPIIEREKADAWDEGFRAGDGHARRVCGHKAPVQLRGRPVPLDTLIGGES